VLGCSGGDEAKGKTGPDWRGRDQLKSGSASRESAVQWGSVTALHVPLAVASRACIAPAGARKKRTIEAEKYDLQRCADLTHKCAKLFLREGTP